MYIHLMSDLHLDHDLEADEAWLASLKPQLGVDLLVLAGDWYSVSRPEKTAELFARLQDLYPRVLAVPGNHDYWRSTVPEAEDAMREASVKSDRVHVCLQPEFVTIAGQRFLGGTMWYRKPPKHQLQDFIDMKQVQGPRGWMFHQQQLLQQKLYEGESVEDVVVVTHHLPHPSSTPEMFRGSPADHFFMCNMTGAIMDRRPKMWLHGHTHDPCDYVVGSTRVVCNPRGYPFEYERRPPYEPKLIAV